MRYRNRLLNSFKHYLSGLTQCIKLKITQLLPDHFGLVFDDQTTSESHYVAYFAKIPTTNQVGYQSVCLTFLPLEYKILQTSDEQTAFLKLVPERFSEYMSNAVAIVGKKCNVNCAVR